MLSRTRAWLRNILAQANPGRGPRQPRRSRALRLETLEGRRLLANDLAAITGMVYFDVTGDGYDIGEEVETAEVFLYRDNGDNVFQPAGDFKSPQPAITNAQGIYRFNGLTAGTYFVQQPAQTADGRTLDEAVSTPIVITAIDAAGTPGVVLDSFATTQQVVSALSAGGNNPDHSSKPVAVGEALGGERDLYALLTDGNGRISLEALAFGMPVLQFDSTSGVAGRRIVSWDGSDANALSLNYTGLGSEDLTEDGNNVGFQLEIGADQNNGRVQIRVYTDANNWSLGEAVIPNTGGLAEQEVLIEFDSFLQGPGAAGPAIMSNVGAVELEILSSALSVNGQINLIGAFGHTEFTRDFANSQIADLWLTKTVNDSTPNVGDDVTFTVTVTNDGPDNATSVAVADALPAGMTYVSSSASQGGYSNLTKTWTVGTLNVGASATLQITASVDTPGTKNNVAQVSAANAYDPDSTPNNNIASEDDQDNAPLTPQIADLSVIKDVDNAAPNVGDNVTFTVTVSNAGPDTATNVDLADVLPPGMSFVSSSSSQGAYVSGSGTWSVGTLARNASASLQITATVDTPGTKTNTAQVSAADQYDPDSTPANNVPAEDDQDPAELTPQVIDLRLAKTVSDATPNVGDNVVFTVTLTNDGPDSATGVAVRDVLPAGLSLVASNANHGTYNEATGVWTVGSLGNGGSAMLLLTAGVDTMGTKVNHAQVSAADQYDIDSTPNNNVPAEDDQDLASLTPQVADLELTKTVNNAEPELGAAVTFRVTVDNKGPDAATGVAIADVLPAGLTFVRANASQGAYQAGSGVWTVGNLAVNGSATLDLTVTVDTLGIKTNTAQVSAADQYDIDSTPNNNVPSEDDQDAASVTPKAADLSLTKTVNNPTPNVGEIVKFTVTVENAGPSTAHNVTVRDVLPAGLTYVSKVGRGTYDPTSGIWDVGTIAVGQKAMLKVRAEVVSRETQVNLAQVQTADEYDPDSTPGNNDPTEDDQDTASVVTEMADLSLTKTVDDATPNVGESVTFTLTLSNAGPDMATRIAVDDVLPSGLTFQSARPERGLYDHGTGLWQIGSLDANDSLTLLVTARVDAGGTHTNIAQVSDAKQYDPDSTPANNVPSEDDQDAAELTPPASVTGYVYCDKNGNGRRDAGEPGIGDVEIELTGTDHKGNPVDRMTTTASNGFYSFTDLPPSDANGYQVIEIQPDEYLDGRETVGSLGGELPPPVLIPQGGQFVPAAIGDHIQEIVVESGDNGVLYNFGEVRTSSISGRVYYDENKDGVKQRSERGISGVQLVLSGEDDLGSLVELTTTTNANGVYRFIDLRPAGPAGYTITEAQPTGFDDGQERVGTPSLNARTLNSQVASRSLSPQAVNDVFSNLALPSGVDAVQFDFGEVINLITKRQYLSTWF